jgi:hypothetical protein
MNGLWLSRLNARYQIGTIAILVTSSILTVIPLLYVPEWRQSLETAVAELGESAGDAAGFVSAAAALLAIGLAWRLRALQLTPRPYWTTPALSRRQALGILLGGLIALFSLLITYREGVAWLKSPPGQALPAQVQQQAMLDDGVQLLGYDLNADVFRPGDRLVFNAYWYALETPEWSFSSFLQLAIGDTVYAEIAKKHPGRIVTTSWGPQGYVRDHHELRLPEHLPAGEYNLVIALYACEERPLDDCAESVQATAIDEDGVARGDSIVIATIRVEAP